jgi:ABC-type polysaccharide/polyol phosphate transport system ATPase subunit
VVSHAMGMIKELCDSASWLEHGRLKKTGTASEVIKAYMSQVAEHTGEAYVDPDRAAPASIQLPG